MMEYLGIPKEELTSADELAIGIVGSIIDLYVEQESQMAKIAELPILADELVQNVLYKKKHVDAAILTIKKNNIIDLVNSILAKNEELTKKLVELKANLKKL